MILVPGIKALRNDPIIFDIFFHICVQKIDGHCMTAMAYIIKPVYLDPYIPCPQPQYEPHIQFLQ